MTSAFFNQVYWAAQQHEVQALRALGEAPERRIRAQELAFKGFLIDAQIHAVGLDPYTEMVDRVEAGYVDQVTGRGWVPNMLQANVQEAPGILTPGLQPYDPKNPWPGSILVSLSLEDYPPIDPLPKPDPPPGLTSLVGKPMGYVWPGNGRPAYIAMGTPGPDGTQYPDPNGRGVFTFHRIGQLGSIVYSLFFTLNAA